MSGTAEDTEERLWIEIIAKETNLETLGKKVFGRPGLGPYLVVLALYLFDALFLQYFVYLHSGFIGPIENPITLVILPAWLFAVWVARRLKFRYHDVVEQLPEPDPVIVKDKETSARTDRLLQAVGVPYESGTVSPAAFDRTIPKRLRVLVFAVAVLVHFLWLIGTVVYTPANWAWMLETWGRPITYLRMGLVLPFGYYIIVSELVSMFLAVHFVLPGEIIGSGRLNFGDPLGYAGLRPVGRLIKRSTVYYVIGLSTFGTFFTFNNAVLNPTIPFLLTIIGTALATLMFFGPVYWLHRYMKAAKEAKMEDIAGTVRERGPDTDDGMFPETFVETPDHVSEYTHEYIRMRKVEDTAEYPVDVAIVQEVLLILILPFLAHVSSIYVFEHLHL